MQIEFDPAKDQINRDTHGVSLALVERFEWDTAIDVLDERHDYNEKRWVAHGFIGDRIFCVVYTIRGSALRVISLRKANKREVNNYVKQTQDRGAN
jgi:uncharacterized DUF497 family protein